MNKLEMLMNKYIMFLVVGLLTVSGAVVFSMAQDSNSDQQNKKAEVGKKAPDFTLKTVDGDEVTLSDYHRKTDDDGNVVRKGKIVVLQWINPDCPYCRRVHSSGLVNEMVKNLKKVTDDVVHLEISSTHYMGPKKIKKYQKEHDIDAPALLDRDGTVGKTYGAKTTPHMYVIDRRGVLRYQGAFDNDVRGKKKEDKRKNYVVNAVKQLEKEEKDVSPNKTKPYGCSVKYKEE